YCGRLGLSREELSALHARGVISSGNLGRVALVHRLAFHLCEKAVMAVNPLSRREVMRFGAFTTVGGVLTPGISLAQAIITDTRGILARDIMVPLGGTTIPPYDGR